MLSHPQMHSSVYESPLTSKVGVRALPGASSPFAAGWLLRFVQLSARASQKTFFVLLKREKPCSR